MRNRKMIGPKVSLAPVDVDDAELLAGWLNDPDVAIPLGGEAYRMITTASIRDGARQPGEEYQFLIVVNEGDVPIGRCSLFRVNLVDRQAMVGIFIGDARYRGRGYGSAALRLLLDFGFNLLNLNSVMLGAFEFNTPALACYRALGFREIGRRRQARLISGRYHDAIFMDLLAEEFRAANPPTYPVTGAPED